MLALLFVFQVAMATGQVLFQRFFYTKSFVKHYMQVRSLILGTANLVAVFGTLSA